MQWLCSAILQTFFKCTARTRLKWAFCIERKIEVNASTACGFKMFFSISLAQHKCSLSCKVQRKWNECYIQSSRHFEYEFFASFNEEKNDLRKIAIEFLKMTIIKVENGMTWEWQVIIRDFTNKAILYVVKIKVKVTRAKYWPKVTFMRKICATRKPYSFWCEK